MKPTIAIDSTGFTAMARELSKRGGVPMEQGVKQGAALVLNSTIKFQGQRLQPKAKMNQRRTERLTAKLNTVSQEGAGGVAYQFGGRKFSPASGLKSSIGKKGTWVGDGPKGVRGKWHLLQGAHSVTPSLLHKAMALDSMRQQQLNQQLRLALSDISKSYGLSVAAWYQIAQNLGIENLVKAPAYAKKAKPSNGRTYQNGTGREITGDAGFYIEIMNDSPLTIGRGGANVLAGAMRSAQSGVTAAIRAGVFDDIKTRASRFPGIFVR